MSGVARLERLTNDALVALGFYTRLPSWRLVPPDRATDFSNVQWAAPLAGVVIGLLLGALNGAVDAMDVPDLLRGILVVACGILLTGALHEDGLADVADGFGGGADRQRKLAIMKDSLLGSYGTLALIVSFMLRVTAIAALTDPVLAALALVAAHGAARALMPVMLRHLPNARGEGVAHRIGRPSQGAVLAAVCIGVTALLPLGFPAVPLGLVVLAIAYIAVASLAHRQIGGQTGDVCGTLQQTGEATILTLCATLLV